MEGRDGAHLIDSDKLFPTLYKYKYTGELGYDGPLYDRFLHMTDDMIGPSLMHIKYSSYVYDRFCIWRTNFSGPIESIITKFTCIYKYIYLYIYKALLPGVAEVLKFLPVILGFFPLRGDSHLVVRVLLAQHRGMTLQFLKDKYQYYNWKPLNNLVLYSLQYLM